MELGRRSTRVGADLLTNWLIDRLFEGGYIPWATEIETGAMEWDVVETKKGTKLCK